MIYRKLGTTGEEISAITFGGASISGEGKGYGFGSISADESVSLLHEAIDLGINCFDTAPIYGFGESEKRMGRAFKDRRKDVFLVSKSGISWHENKRVDMNNDPIIAKRMIEQSLVDLHTDYIDLYMVHWPDKKHDIRDTLKVFVDAQKAGKIKYIGLCNTNLNELEKAKEIAKIDVIQSEYNFLMRHNEEIFPYINKQDVGFMSWGTLEKGILTGRVGKDRKFDDNDCRKTAPWWKKDEVLKKIEVVEKISEHIKDKNFDLLSFTLGFNLSKSELTSALCGARNSGQLTGLVKALENLPTQADLDELERYYE